MSNQIDVTVSNNIDITVDTNQPNNISIVENEDVSISIEEVIQNVLVNTNDTPTITISNPNSPNVTVTSVEQQIIKVGNGSGDLHYVFTQNIPSSTWTIVHNLNKKPSVTVVNSADDVVYGDVTYVDKNELIINFTSMFSGKAYLN